jgi:acetyl esterase/lipase
MNSKSSQMMDDVVPLVFRPEKVANYARDVVWASPGGRDLLLDVSWPEGEGPFPVLVWIHGGAWEFFSKEANEGLACYFTNRGYVVFNVNYRMVPEVPMQIIIEDAMGAVIWAKDHAKDYNGDPTRVAVAGHSAGGHLTAMIAVACPDPYFTPTYQSAKGADCSVDAAIPVSGVYDFVTRGKERSEWTEEIFGLAYEAAPELYEKSSPISYARADLPPQLVVYAEEEWLREANENWIKLMEEAGAPVESYMQPGVDHLWPTWHWREPAQQTFARMVEFLDGQFK